jgi:hypothetical protein
MAVNAKLGVDLTSFESGIRTGQSILKGLKAEMKATEAEFKATGNSEQLLANKTKVLNSQLQAQKGIADQAKQALKAMDDAGVEPTEAAYQKLYATLMNANAGMYETQAALTGLDSTAQEAASSAENLTNSVNGIGRKISLEQVIGGIGKITDGLENAAKKAVHLGEQIWDSIMNSAKWADDTATMAQMYGIDVETFQRMQKLVVNGLDTSVEAVLKAQSKLKKGIGSDSKEVTEAFNTLNMSVKEWQTVAGQSGSMLVAKDNLELFWEAGQKILALKDENQQEDLAQTLFGRSWHDLVPLFESYKTVEEYNEALKQTQINSAEDVEKLAELNDKVSELKGNFETLANDVMAQLAPKLTDAATALNGVLTSILDYLETEDGQKMLKSLGDSVSTLFEDLGKIDPKSVVESFTTVFNGLVDGLKWIVDHQGTVIGALQTIVAGWAALKLSGGVLEIIKMIEAFKGLGNGGGGGNGDVSTGGGTPSWLAGITGKIAEYAPVMSWFSSVNGGPLLDWFTHEGPFGTIFQGTESIGDWWTRTQAEIAERASTAGEDWKNLFKTILGLGDLGADQDFLDFEEALRQQINDDLNSKPFDFEADPKVPENAAAQISSDIGIVPVYVRIVGGAGGGKDWVVRESRANGLPFVPYDGYLAELHKGERVVPAREIQSRNYSSNLYVESMIMNNGADAEGLAAAMAAAQRRTMSGYGS